MKYGNEKKMAKAIFFLICYSAEGVGNAKSL